MGECGSGEYGDFGLSNKKDKMDVNKGNIASNLLKPYKVRQFLLVSSLVLLAFKIGEIVPGLITISLGTWMNRAFILAPYIALVFIISMWNPSGDRLHFNLRLPSMTNRSLPIKYLILVFITSLFAGLIMLWLVGNYQSWEIVGLFIFLGSAITMLVLGSLKPGLGPIVFFAVYPFLWFAEGRLNASLYWLLKETTNIPVWLQNFINDWRNVHIVMAVFAIGFLFYIVKNFNKLERTVLDIPIVLLLIWTFISVITANDPSRAINFYFWRWVFPTVFFYATYISMRNEKGMINIRIAFIALLFFMCLLDIQNASRLGASIYTQEAIEFTGEKRAFSWTIIAYQAGPWIVLLLPFALSLLFDQKEKVLIRIFSLFSIAVASVLIIWEMQRTVILSLGVLAVLGLIFYYHTWKKQLLVYCSIILFGVIFLKEKIIEMITLTRPEFLQDNPFTMASNLDRIYLIEHGWNIVKNNPVFGIGPGGFKLLGIGLYTPESAAHNIFLDIIIESGFFACVLFMAIMIIPVYKSIKMSLLNPDKKLYPYDVRPFVISLLIFNVHLLTHSSWQYGEQIGVFCIIAVLLFAIQSK